MTRDEGTALPPSIDSRTITALSERVAVIETQQTSLKEDTGVIRASIHGVYNEMQKFVQAEQKCADSLSQILGTIKDLPSIAQTAVVFTEMRADLKEVIDERQRREGLAAFGKRFTMIIAAVAGLVAAIGGIVAGWIWLARHVVLPP